MNNFKKVEGILYSYNKIEAEIRNIDIDIEIIENEYEYQGVGSISYEEKTGPTNAFSSRVENEVVKKDNLICQLEKQKRYKQLQIKKIDNALSYLDETKRRLVELKYFDKRTYMYIAEELGYEENYIYQLKIDIIKKIQNLIV